MQNLPQKVSSINPVSSLTNLMSRETEGPHCGHAEHVHFELKSGGAVGIWCLWKAGIPSGICLKVNRRINGKSWLPVLSSDHWITLKGNLFNHPMSVKYQPGACKKASLVFQWLGFLSWEKYLLFKNTPNICAVLMFKWGSSEQQLTWAHSGHSLFLHEHLKMLMEIFAALHLRSQ